MNKDTKIIKGLCVALGIISVFLVVGFVGGLERSTITIGKFIIINIVLWALFTISVVGWYKMQSIEDGRIRHGRTGKNF